MATHGRDVPVVPPYMRRHDRCEPIGMNYEYDYEIMCMSPRYVWKCRMS